MEGFILRMRYVIYQFIMVSLSLTPSMVSVSILLLEMTHLSVYFYYSVRYRYPKNWILVASKFNVGLTIIYFSLLAFTLSLRQDSSEEMSFVSATLQGFGMTVAVNCFLLETLLLLLNIATSVYEAYTNWRNGIPRQKSIPSLWIRELVAEIDAQRTQIKEEKGKKMNSS